MSTLAEIEEAIESLAPTEQEALAAWLESRRKARGDEALHRPVGGFIEKWAGAFPARAAENDDARQAYLLAKHAK